MVETRFNPTTPVSSVAVLVTDKDNPRFGQIGRMTLHDWRESGLMYVIFADNKEEEYHDGWIRGDPKSPVRILDRVNDPQSLIDEYLKLGVGDMDSLRKKYNQVFSDYPL